MTFTQVLFLVIGTLSASGVVAGKNATQMRTATFLSVACYVLATVLAIAA